MENLWRAQKWQKNDKVRIDIGSCHVRRAFYTIFIAFLHSRCRDRHSETEYITKCMSKSVYDDVYALVAQTLTQPSCESFDMQ